MCVFCIPVSVPGLVRSPSLRRASRGASMGHAVLLTFSTVGNRLPWSYLHTGTLPRLISFVSHSYENCRVCTQNSHSGSPRAKPRGTPSCVLPNVPSTRLGAGIGRFLRSVHSAFSVISALNPSFPFFQFSTVNFQPSHHPSSLAATLMDPLASVANTRLTLRLSPLDATLTKNRGRVGLVLCLLNLLYILSRKTATPFPQRWGQLRKGRTVFRREARYRSKTQFSGGGGGGGAVVRNFPR